MSPWRAGFPVITNTGTTGSISDYSFSFHNVGAAGNFRLTIPGPPTGKARARVTHHGTYTPKLTVLAENEIRAIWRENGSPTLTGAVSVYVNAYVGRPASHFKRDGTLSAKGQRERRCIRRPDVDNIGKLVLDALNKHAWLDDHQVTQLFCSREWTQGQPATVIQAWELG